MSPPSNSNGFTRPENLFWHRSENIHWSSFFMSFLLRECISRENWKSVYPDKNEMCISRQVYYTKNYKKTDFTNLGYHIRGEMITNWPVRKTSIWIRVGGGHKLHKDGKLGMPKFCFRFTTMLANSNFSFFLGRNKIHFTPPPSLLEMSPVFWLYFDMNPEFFGRYNG
jgi:hypothetical protein